MIFSESAHQSPPLVAMALYSPYSTLLDAYDASEFTVAFSLKDLMNAKPTQTTHRVTVIIGAGPKLGFSLAQKFGEGGQKIAIASRSRQKNITLERELNDKGIHCQAFACDASNRESVKSTFEEIRSSLGKPCTLIYNAGQFLHSKFLKISPSDFVSAWMNNCYGGFLAAQECIPDMLGHGRGTILFTGATASIRGSSGFAALTVGKAGLRTLSQSLAREFGAQGIHVCHVVIDGKIRDDRSSGATNGCETQLNPDDIAQSYWDIAQQAPSAWTLELDLRPSGENF